LAAGIINQRTSKQVAISDKKAPPFTVSEYQIGDIPSGAYSDQKAMPAIKWIK